MCVRVCVLRILFDSHRRACVITIVLLVVGDKAGVAHADDDKHPQHRWALHTCILIIILYFEGCFVSNVYFAFVATQMNMWLL